MVRTVPMETLGFADPAPHSHAMLPAKVGFLKAMWELATVAWHGRMLEALSDEGDRGYFLLF